MSRFEQRKDFGPAQMLASRGLKVDPKNAVVHLENTGNESDLLRQQNIYWREGYDKFHGDDSGIYMQLPREEVEANLRRYERESNERLTRPSRLQGDFGGAAVSSVVRGIDAEGETSGGYGPAPGSGEAGWSPAEQDRLAPAAVRGVVAGGSGNSGGGASAAWAGAAGLRDLDFDGSAAGARRASGDGAAVDGAGAERGLARQLGGVRLGRVHYSRHFVGDRGDDGG